VTRAALARRDARGAMAEPPLPPAQHAALSPSQRDGMSAETEKLRRRKTCFFLDECGLALKLPKMPVMTAQCFFHKFFARESLRRHDRFVVAQACLFLAAKVEESPVSLRQLVGTCHGVRYAGKNQRPPDEVQERELKGAVVAAERAVLYVRRGVHLGEGRGRARHTSPTHIAPRVRCRDVGLCRPSASTSASRTRW
jgi:hypothetical protein